jgi:hypothetical protein
VILRQNKSFAVDQRLKKQQRNPDPMGPRTASPDPAVPQGQTRKKKKRKSKKKK